MIYVSLIEDWLAKVISKIVMIDDAGISLCLVIGIDSIGCHVCYHAILTLHV